MKKIADDLYGFIQENYHSLIRDKFLKWKTKKDMKIPDLGSCEGNNHCHITHNGKEKCIEHIEDCESHWKLCSDGCHNECACQERRS